MLVRFYIQREESALTVQVCMFLLVNSWILHILTNLIVYINIVSVLLYVHLVVLTCMNATSVLYNHECL